MTMWSEGKIARAIALRQTIGEIWMARKKEMAC